MGALAENRHVEAKLYLPSSVNVKQTITGEIMTITEVKYSATGVLLIMQL